MDAWLNRMYERHGPLYVVLAIGLIGAFISFVIGPIALAGGAHFEGLGLGEYFLALAACWGASLLGFGLLLVWAHDLRTLLRWGLLRGREPLGPREAQAAFTGPRKTMIPAGVCAGAVVGPVAIASLALGSGHTTAIDWSGLAVGALLSVLLAMLGLYASIELALRPIRAQLSRDGFSVTPAGSLGTNLLVGLLALTFTASCLLGSLRVTRAHDSPSSVLGVYAIAAGITLAFGLILAPFLAASVLGPVRDLIKGTRAVAAGDLDTVVPVTSNDELGELALKFNEMVADLRRKSLDLRASQARIVASADEARRKVERDLHDGAQQRLVLAQLKLGIAAREVGGDARRDRERLAELGGDLAAALSELRDLAHGLYPATLESEGLTGALREAAANAGIPTTVDCDGTGRHPAEVERAVYFCCLEALQNAAKHAGGEAKAIVRVVERNGNVEFEVSDDGHGFESAAATSGIGLQNMSDRIGALAGRVVVNSVPGQGTRVSGTIPSSGDPARQSS